MATTACTSYERKGSNIHSFILLMKVKSSNIHSFILLMKVKSSNTSLSFFNSRERNRHMDS